MTSNPLLHLQSKKNSFNIHQAATPHILHYVFSYAALINWDFSNVLEPTLENPQTFYCATYNPTVRR
jgi:hypothetical protein